QIIFFIDSHHFQIATRLPLVSHLPGHFLSLERAAREGITAGAADMAMHFLHAVRGTLTLEVVPLHRPLKALALARRSNVDRRHLLAAPDRPLLADRHLACRSAKLANKSLRLTIGFGGQLHPCLGSRFRTCAVELRYVTALTATGQTPRHIGKAKLHRLVTIS